MSHTTNFACFLIDCCFVSGLLLSYRQYVPLHASSPLRVRVCEHALQSQRWAEDAAAPRPSACSHAWTAKSKSALACAMPGRSQR